MNLGETDGQEEAQFCGERFVMKHDLQLCYFDQEGRDACYPAPCSTGWLAAVVGGVGKVNNLNLLCC